jgi:NTP pyrophosphatase (non-canonical NTP hydrolase)
MRKCGDLMKLRTVQRNVWANKRRKGFNTTNVPMEICLLQGEIAELFDAWRRKEASVGEELADVAIYLLGLSQMLGFDLEEEIAKKVAINEQRRYVEQNGSLVKVASHQPETATRSAEPVALLLPFPPLEPEG